MHLLIIRLCLDFGLLVLIWIIQLVVYPSFKYYLRVQLFEWHQKYTRQITNIVLPLMLGQLVCAGIQLWNGFNWYTGSSCLIIGLLWGSTFLQFVPLHHQIDKEGFKEEVLEQLVQKNWFRTWLWTMLFFISLVKVIS